MENSLKESAIPMTEQEYLAKKGLSSPISDFLMDKLRCNRQIRTEHGKKQFYRDADKANQKYHEDREAARQEYRQLVNEGKLRDKTSIERSLDTAQGHPDNASVQAARRLLAKRGIDWRTGKKFEEVSACE